MIGMDSRNGPAQWTGAVAIRFYRCACKRTIEGVDRETVVRRMTGRHHAGWSSCGRRREPDKIARRVHSLTNPA